MKLKQGDVAPSFSLQSTSGKEVDLISLRGSKVLLYFYPKDDTPGCTIEACEFRDLNEKLKKAGVLIFGISADNIKSHEKFRTKFSLNFDLLADKDKEISRAYEVLIKKKMYGREYMGIGRISFLIDEEGKIEKIWNPVDPNGHAQEVLDLVIK